MILLYMQGLENRFGFTARKTVAILTEHTGGTATCMHKAVCEVCKAEYGENDPSRHGNLIHVDAKASTAVSEGNIGTGIVVNVESILRMYNCKYSDCL